MKKHNFCRLASESNIVVHASSMLSKAGIKRSRIVLTALLIASIQIGAEVTVTGSTGADATYTTLKAAFDAINANTNQSGKDILIAITANTTETASAVLNQPASIWNSLTIYPTASNLAIDGALAAPIIDLNGADKVTIDGRVDRSGSTASLTISNRSTSSTSGTSAIKLYNDASNNTVRYCYILGSHTNSSTSGSGSGVIYFGTGSSTGNESNTIEYCNISHAGTDSNRPNFTIYSSTGTAITNSNNSISNNYIYDFFRPNGATCNCIYLTSNNNDGWTISGNSFYETTSFNETSSANYSVIRVDNNSGITVTNNYIGGSGPNCNGTWSKGSGTNIYSTFKGIYVFGTSTASSINGNTIKNFSWTDTGTGAVSTWRAIEIGSGTVNIGDISGNVIGSVNPSESESIIFNSKYTGSAASGIYIGNATVNCLNNQIGGIKATNTAASEVSVYGIYKTNLSALTANNNIINNLNAIATGTTTAQTVSGIHIAVSGNSSTSAHTVNTNFIQNLYNSGSTAGVINGIYLGGYTGVYSIANNIVSLSNNNTATLYGINEASTGTSTNATNIYFNTVYIAGAPTSGSLNSYALYSSGATKTRNIKNNQLYNNRVNSGATGKNYAIGITYTSGTFACDYNNLYTTTDTYNYLGVFGGTDKLDLNAWKNLQSSNDANSFSANPGFVLAGGSSATDYKATALSGINISGVTTDYIGNTRNSTPKIGAWEESFATWNGTAWNVTPDATISTILNGNYSGVGFTCLNLTVNAGKQLSVTSGTLTVNGNLTLKSDAANGTATFIDNGGTLSVGANKTFVEQYLTTGRNWYISSPVSAATSNVFAASATNPIYYYVETSPNTWSQITNTSTNLDTKKGYIANINSDRVVTFNGGSLNTGNQTIFGLTSAGASFTGFNLVGNPYPSYLNWSTTLKNNVSTSVWYRSKSTGTYLFQTYNAAGAGIGTNGGTNLIPSMQAFWVKVTSGTGSIDLTNDDRTHLDQSISTNRLKAPKTDNRTIVRLQVSNGINSDETVIYTDTQASNDLDQFDSNKMFNNNPAVPEIYSLIQNEKLAINGYNTISENQEVNIGFKTTSANTFTINASEIKNLSPDTKLVLVDKLQGNTEFDLTNGESYSFESGIVTDNNRFNLIYKTTKTTTGIANSEKAMVMYKNMQNEIIIRSEEGIIYTVFNALGQKIKNGTTLQKQTTITGLKTGQMYIVKVGNMAQHIILN